MSGASAAMWPALKVMIPNISCRPGGLSNDTAKNLGGLFASREDTLFGVDSDPGRSISRDKVLPAARRPRLLLAEQRSAAAVHKSVASPHTGQDAACQPVLRSGLQVAEVIVEALSQRGAEQKVVEIVQGKQVPQLPTDKYFDI
jgi:hypothetical protein